MVGVPESKRANGGSEVAVSLVTFPGAAWDRCQQETGEYMPAPIYTHQSSIGQIYRYSASIPITSGPTGEALSDGKAEN